MIQRVFPSALIIPEMLKQSQLESLQRDRFMSSNCLGTISIRFNLVIGNRQIVVVAMERFLEITAPYLHFFQPPIYFDSNKLDWKLHRQKHTSQQQSDPSAHVPAFQWTKPPSKLRHELPEPEYRLQLFK